MVNAKHPDASVRNLRKASHTAVGPVRPVRLNYLHKRSHGLLVSATSPASGLGLCLGRESLRHTVLLIGDKVVGNAFSIFRSGLIARSRGVMLIVASSKLLRSWDGERYNIILKNVVEETACPSVE